MTTLTHTKEITWKDEVKFKKWLEEHDIEDYCKYCVHDEDCPHGMTCYGDMPIEPPCVDVDNMMYLLDVFT